MISFPPAKINLGLQVLRKRTDGYHDLATVMQEIPLCDLLEIVPSAEFQFTSSGLPIPEGINLCQRAWELVQQQFRIPPVHIHLHKITPMGAGLGGGSSDAATTIKMLDELFNLNLGVNRQEELSAQLGSDCAFFVRGGTQYATGRGEILEPLSIDLPRWLVVTNPGIHISTAEAYHAVIPNADAPDLKNIIRSGNWKNQLLNDFEKSARINHSEIDQLINRFYEMEAVYAAMSGSGSTVFAFFEEKPDFIPDNRQLTFLLDLANNQAVNL